MIQRLQSLFLLAVFIINLFIFFTPLYDRAITDPADWVGIGFALSLTLSMAIALIAIFLYKNRLKQLSWVKIGTWVQICALAIGTGILFTLGGFGTFLLEEATSLLFVFLAFVCFWQAGSYIRKDEELVRSMDRIR